MIPIERITEQELEKRMNGLPPRLQDALNSGSILLAVDQICRNHHLVDEERVLMVHQIVAVALFGFIHSYDISREINESLALNNPKLANSIAQELEAKVFAPLKTDLEAVYEPLAQNAAAAQAAPMPISEIGKSDLPIIDLEAKPAPPAPPSVRSTSEIAKPAPGTASAPPPVKTFPLAAQEKAPVPLAPMPAMKPLTTAPITERRPAAPAAPPPRPVSEILPQKEKIPAPLGKEALPAVAQPQKPAEPAPTPFFIHKETQLEPVKPGSDFRLEFLTPKFKDVKAGAGPPPSGAAELVIGKKSDEKKPGAKQTEVTPPRVVHYSQWKTPLEPSAPAPERKKEGPAPIMLSHAGGAPLRDISSAARPQPAVPPPVRAAGAVPPPPPVKPFEAKPFIAQTPTPRPPQPAPPPRLNIPQPLVVRQDETKPQSPIAAKPPTMQSPSPPPPPFAQEKKPTPAPQPPFPQRPGSTSPPTPQKPPTPQPPLSPTPPAPAPERRPMPPSPTPPSPPPPARKPDRGEEVIDLGAL